MTFNITYLIYSLFVPLEYNQSVHKNFGKQGVDVFWKGMKFAKPRKARFNKLEIFVSKRASSRTLQLVGNFIFTIYIQITLLMEVYWKYWKYSIFQTFSNNSKACESVKGKMKL